MLIGRDCAEEPSDQFMAEGLIGGGEYGPEPTGEFVELFELSAKAGLSKTEASETDKLGLRDCGFCSLTLPVLLGTSFRLSALILS